MNEFWNKVRLCHDEIRDFVETVNLVYIDFNRLDVLQDNLAYFIFIQDYLTAIKTNAKTWEWLSVNYLWNENGKDFSWGWFRFDRSFKKSVRDRFVFRFRYLFFVTQPNFSKMSTFGTFFKMLTYLWKFISSKTFFETFRKFPLDRGVLYRRFYTIYF